MSGRTGPRHLFVSLMMEYNWVLKINHPNKKDLIETVLFALKWLCSRGSVRVDSQSRWSTGEAARQRAFLTLSPAEECAPFARPRATICSLSPSVYSGCPVIGVDMSGRSCRLKSHRSLWIYELWGEFVKGWTAYGHRMYGRGWEMLSGMVRKYSGYK